MVPMALGAGEGGEQNAPLARAVSADCCSRLSQTLVFVPTMYRLLRRVPQTAAEHFTTMQGHEMKPEEKVRETDYGNDIVVHDEAAVSTRFDPDTGLRVKKTALIVIAVLVVGFIAVWVDRFFKDAVCRAPPTGGHGRVPVDVIEARAVGAAQRFVLPGQTAAWHSAPFTRG